MKKQLFMTGGLGNQMFEYAFFLACKKKGVNIVLNIDMYNINRMHNGYMLGHAFGIIDNILSTNVLSTFLSRVIRRFCPKGLVYNEQYGVYSNKAFSTKCLYINGVFVGEPYFSNVIDDLQTVFSFIGIDKRNTNYAVRMNIENSVSIHIRRGDYVGKPKYAVCDKSYFKQAISYINSFVNNPKYYVFSDDPHWSNNFMKQMDVEYEIIAHNKGIDSYKDMYLMTQCKYNIIANSTFSWWGAWLNRYTNKCVVCPKIWIVGEEYNPCPKNWIRI